MRRAPRPCLHTACPELVTVGSYCKAHDRGYDRRRPSSSVRGYDSTWRKIRSAKLNRDPFCYSCGDPANEVDHIDGNARNNDPSNLRSACKPCHSRRTAREQGFARPKAVSSRGVGSETDPPLNFSRYGFA